MVNSNPPDHRRMRDVYEKALRPGQMAQLLPMIEAECRQLLDALPVDTAVARCCARLHVTDPKSQNDSYIAATAIVHGLTLVTRNETDFAATGAPLLNPWR